MTFLKSLVIVLVLANAGYFLWTRGIAHREDAGSQAPAATLKLTSEVPGSQRGAATAADDDQASSSGTAGIVGAVFGATSVIAAVDGSAFVASAGIDAVHCVCRRYRQKIRSDGAADPRARNRAQSEGRPGHTRRSW